MIIERVYRPRQFDLSGLKGISDRTLEMHFELYEGYVEQTNLLAERIAGFLKDGRPSRPGSTAVLARRPGSARPAERSPVPAVVRRGAFVLGVLLFPRAVMAFELTSPAFGNGESIPRQHTCEGADASPPLLWKDPPPGTKSFALVCDDPDAPARTWVHWVLYAVPPTAHALPEGVKATPTLPDGSRQGRNDFGKIGYGGPCPPPGAPHRYYFRLHAVDRMIDLAPGATKAELLKAIEGHTLATSELMGLYGRR